MTFRCIYCAEEKDDAEKTNEHVWPSAMGGNKLPTKFQLNQCCKRCNNNLGCFVDSAFYHEFFVYHDHQMPHLGFLRPPEPKYVPCHYLGRMEPHPLNGRSIEYWAGPRGERIYFVHEKDRDEFEYVAKGHPIRRKSDPGRIYFSLVKPETYWFWISLHSIRKNFKKAKIYCFTQISNNTGSIEAKRIFEAIRNKNQFPDDEFEYFQGKIFDNSKIHSRLRIDLGVTSRFSAKLAIGIGFIYFGQKFFTHPQFIALKYSMMSSSALLNDRPNHIARFVTAAEGDAFPPKTPAGTRIQICQTKIGLSTFVVFPSGNRIVILLEGKPINLSQNYFGEHYFITPAREQALSFSLSEITETAQSFKPNRLCEIESEMLSVDNLDAQVEQLEKGTHHSHENRHLEH